jgi:hypothetical protein
VHVGVDSLEVQPPLLYIFTSSVPYLWIKNSKFLIVAAEIFFCVSYVWNENAGKLNVGPHCPLHCPPCSIAQHKRNWNEVDLHLE